MKEAYDKHIKMTSFLSSENCSAAAKNFIQMQRLQKTFVMVALLHDAKKSRDYDWLVGGGQFPATRVANGPYPLDVAKVNL